jgi:protein-tyrosine phosphatase
VTLTPEPLDLDRRIAFQAVFNVRDLGGLRTDDGRTVRRGLVFRGDGVHRLDGEDLEVARALGLRTVIDLRTRGEIDHGRVPDALGANWHHLPLISEMWSERGFQATEGAVAFLRDRYLEMLVEGREQLARAVELIADRSPSLFHCAAGKDRTGVLAALVLGLLGVAPEDIADDNHLSASGMVAMRVWGQATYPDAADAMTRQPAEYLEAPVDAMLAFLERVDEEHGSIRGLARDLGIGDDVVARLHAALLD